jgi:hypothetical protein
MLPLSLRARGYAVTGALIAVTTAPAWAERAPAPETRGSTSMVCSQVSDGTFTCTTAWGSGNGIPQVVHMPAPADESGRAAAAERIRAWEAYCQPQLRYDRYGVGRYVYRVVGCEFGRRHD